MVALRGVLIVLEVPTTTSRVRWTDPLLTLFVAVASAKITHGQLGRMKVKLGDETLYLAAGLHPDAAHPIAQSSPLYGLWYRALSVFEPEPHRLYLLNWFLLTATLPVLLFALARRSGAPRWASVLASIAWAVSGAALVWPSGSKLATVILAVGALGATWVPSRFARWTIAAVSLVAAAGIRPELAPAAALVSLGVAVWGLSAARVRRRRLLGAALVTAVALGSAVVLPSPFTDNRTLSAFEQHYALNVAAAQDARGAPDPVDPWTDAERATKPAFGDAGSIAEAALENPSAFAWHVGQNVLKLPAAAASVAGPSRRLGGALHALSYALLGALSLAGVIGGARVLLRRAPGRRRARAWGPIAVSVAVAGAASVLTIHPREHYLVAPLFFLFVLAATAAANVRAPDMLTRRPTLRTAALRTAALPVALALAAFVVAPSAWLAAPPKAKVRKHTVQRTIGTLKTLGLSGPVRMLEARLGHATYAGLPFHSVDPSERTDDEHMWDFLDKRGVDVVVVDKRLRAHSRFDDDLQEDEEVARAGRHHGFDTVWVEGTEVILLVRRRS